MALYSWLIVAFDYGTTIVIDRISFLQCLYLQLKEIDAFATQNRRANLFDYTILSYSSGSRGGGGRE